MIVRRSSLRQIILGCIVIYLSFMNLYRIYHILVTLLSSRQGEATQSLLRTVSAEETCIELVTVHTSSAQYSKLTLTSLGEASFSA